MIKKVAFISFGTGGTMGHMSLVTKLALRLLNSGFKCTILSEYDYKSFSNINNPKIRYIRIPKQRHKKTVAGCLDYRYKKNIINIIKREKFLVLIFSTFFDPGLVKYAKENKIKTILISYLLRDSHRKAFKIRKYYKYFDRIFTLKDIVNIEINFPNEEIVNPFFDVCQQRKDIKLKKVNNILVTCGGGGRPSAKLFFNKICNIIPKIIQKNQNIHFTLIKGNYKGNFANLPNSDIIEWSNDFLSKLKNYDLVISEAGYFTILDLLVMRKPAILIPGERRIDNQELRALNFQERGCGICIFPVENETSFSDELNKLIKNPSILLKFSRNIDRNYNNFLSCKNLAEAILEWVTK